LITLHFFAADAFAIIFIISGGFHAAISISFHFG
jgi:hypothetical protein